MQTTIFVLICAITFAQILTYSFAADLPEEGKVKATSKSEVSKDRIVDILRIFSTSSSVPIKKGGYSNSACAQCALRKISSTLLLGGVPLKEVSSRICGRFPQNFKYALAAEVRKFQRIGLKSIEIENISTDKENNLIIDFDVLVDPKYNELIHDALRLAITTIDLNRVFKYKQCY